jgi:hypothetical protein
MEQMNLFQRIRGIIVEPKTYFASIQKEDDILRPWIFFAIMSGLAYALMMPGMVLYYQSTIGLNYIFTMVWFLIIYFIGLGGIFVGAGIFHLFFMIVGTKERYVQTFKLLSYTSLLGVIFAPFTVLMASPFTILPYMLISVAYMAYYVVIEVFAGMALHKLSVLRVLTAVLFIPMIIAFLLFLIFMAFIISLVVMGAGA